MRKYLKSLNAKNSAWLIPVVFVFIGIFSPTPVERAIYADELSQTISGIMGLLLISAVFLYGFIAGKGVKNVDKER